MARAVMTLAAAAVAVGANPGPAPLALAWLPAVCAVYAYVLPPRPAAGITLGALAVLVVLAAAAGTAGHRPSTAYAACAVCLIAAGLAAGTLRAVGESRADGPLVAASATAEAAELPAVVDPQPVDRRTVPTSSGSSRTAPRARRPPASRRAPPVYPVRTPCSRPPAARRRDQASSAAGWACSSSPCRAPASCRAAVGRGAAQAALDTLARRARAWLPAGDVVAWLGRRPARRAPRGRRRPTCLVVARRLAALLAEPRGGRAERADAAGVRGRDARGRRPRRPRRRCCGARWRRPRCRRPSCSRWHPRPATAGTPPPTRSSRSCGRRWAPVASGSPCSPSSPSGPSPGTTASSPSRPWPAGPGRTAWRSPPARFVARRPTCRARRCCSARPSSRRASTRSSSVARAGEQGLGLAVNVAPEQLVGAGCGRGRCFRLSRPAGSSRAR